MILPPPQNPHHPHPDHLGSVARGDGLGQLGHRLHPPGPDLDCILAPALVFLTFFSRQYTKLLGVLAVSGGCHLLALLYVITFMTQKTQKQPATLRAVFSFKSFFDGVSVVFQKRPQGLRGVILTVIVTGLLCEFTWGVRFVGDGFY